MPQAARTRLDAGKLLDGSMLYGECKWRKEVVGENVLDELIERATRVETRAPLTLQRYAVPDVGT